MNRAVELLEDLRARGFRLRADGRDLKVTPPQRGALTPELVSELRSVKSDLLRLLTPDPATACSPACSPVTGPEALSWRTAAMRRMVRPGESLRVLTALPGRTPEQWTEEGCLSCGEPLAGAVYRCGPCVEAARAVTGEFMGAGKEGRG